MTPPKAKYDIGTEPSGLSPREHAIWRLGILTTLLGAIEQGNIEKPDSYFMGAMESEYKARKKQLRDSSPMLAPSR